MVQLQGELEQARQQMLTLGQRFDGLAGAHNTLLQAHNNLARESDQMLKQRAKEIQDLEGSIGGLLKKQHCDLLDLKSMKPTTFRGDRNEKWKPWARKTKAYCNGKSDGFRGALE